MNKRQFILHDVKTYFKKIGKQRFVELAQGYIDRSRE